MTKASDLNLAVLTLSVSVGEYTTYPRILISNLNTDCLEEFAELAAASYLGEGDEPQEYGGYYARDGEAFVKVERLDTIQLSTYLELRSILPSFEEDETRDALGVAPGVGY